MKYKKAFDIKKRVSKLIKVLNLKHIRSKNIHCIRSFDAKTRAYARIWGTAKIFKEVVGLEPHYIIEVNSKRFDKLSDREQLETLVHELMHIPKTFSGALLSHRGKGRRINHHEINKLLKNKF
jgi:predicted metallopeptidase